MATPSDGAGMPASRFPLLTRVAPPLLAIPLIVFVGIFSREPFRSFDTYFHLRFGDEFGTGAWSLTAPGQPSVASTEAWVPTQWLGQVLMSQTHDVMGDRGLGVLFAVLIAAVGVGLYWTARCRGGPVTAAALAVVSLIAMHPWLSLRPQMFSFLFACLVVLAWESVRRGGRTPWWLVPLGWLWACSHGMWVLGFGISAAAVAGLAVEKRPDRSTALRWVAVPVGMLLAACLTPVGPRLVSAVLVVNSRSEHFAEWAAPELLTTTGAWPVALLAGTTLLLVARKRAAPYDVTMVAVAGVLAVYSWRTVPLAVIVLLPLAGGLLRSTPQSPERRLVERFTVLALAGVAVLAGPGVASDVDGGIAGDLEPFRTRLDKIPAGTMVLTDRATGSALLWRAANIDVPIHGYGDVYTEDELDTLDDVLFLNAGWDDTVRALGARQALLPPDNRLAYALQLEGWKVESESGDLVWLSAPDGWIGDRRDRRGFVPDVADLT